MTYPTSFMERHRVVLLEETSARVAVLTDTTPGAGLRRLLESYHGKRVSFALRSPEELVVRMQRAAAFELPVVGDTGSNEYGAIAISHATEGAPAVNLVNSLLNDAVRNRASDIHIEAHHERIGVRYRIDGRLRPAEETRTGRPIVIRGAFVSVSARLKVLAGLNAAERRRPQDGRFTARLPEDTFDVRFSSMPTIGGESIVLRLFPRTQNAFSLGELGMPAPVLDAVVGSVRRASGFLIISGPTGSGKTTTLHAALRHISEGTLKIVTIEDPVEYRLDEVEQIQTNDAAGLTFESLLRRVLRQDPDVIMVGEIRDTPTAELSVRAALTGHLVLATVHSRSAADVPDRLVDLGVEPSLLQLLRPTLLAQRLVRSRCPDCGGPPGCASCYHTGFRGRTGLFELVGPDGTHLTLDADGHAKLRAGITTPEEVAWAVAV